MAYSQEEIEFCFSSICTRIGKGEALRNILKDSEMPVSQTFYKWLDSDKNKSIQYARATELRADNIFEDIIDIADDNRKDLQTDKDGNERTNSDVIQRSRLMVDARKWYLSKLNPKKYGDKIETTLEGGEKPIEHQVNYSQLSDEALLEIANATNKQE